MTEEPEKTESEIPVAIQAAESPPLPAASDGLDLGMYDLPAVVSSTAPVDTSGGAIRLGILALGGAGGRIGEAFVRLGYARVVAVNTAPQDLDGVDLPARQKLLLRSIEGGGAGKNMVVGAESFDSHRDEIYEVMERTWGDVDQIMLLLGAGGGTGGGALPGAVKLAARYVNEHIRDRRGDKPSAGERISVVVALPGKVERKIAAISDNAAGVLRFLAVAADAREVASIVVADNERLDALYGQHLPAQGGLAALNDRIAALWHFFNLISVRPSAIAALDAANWADVCRASGFSIMGAARTADTTPEAVRAAVRDDLPRTVLCAGFDLKTAIAGAYVVVAGAAELAAPGSRAAFEAGYSNLCELAPDAVLHKGVYEGSRAGVLVHVMLAGMKLGAKVIDELKRS